MTVRQSINLKFVSFMKITTRLEKLIQNISQDFSLEKLSKSPARFNLQKLEWFNREYIKLMSLSEFCIRASLNKLQSQKLDSALVDSTNISENSPLKFRTGDYIFFVDLEKEKVLCMDDLDGVENLNQNITNFAFGGRYYLIGGGRKDDENPIENLKREITEETYGKIELDGSKIIKICDYKVYKPFHYENEGDFAGRFINVYFYPLKVEQIDSYTLVDGTTHKVDWYDLNSFLADNKYLNYPIWQDFCIENNLPLLETSIEIKYQYLAWLLDKNRITKLSEFGTESSVILDWKQPTKADITWKKSTEPESLSNLQEISVFVLELINTDQAKSLQQNLLDSIFSKNQAELNFKTSLDYFETEIKNWLTQNQKPVGDYLWPLRVGLSGQSKSPSPFELLAVLNPNEVKKRLELILS